MNDERVRIAVVDHGAGNLVSISHALERVGAEPHVTDEPNGLADAHGVVLPGVGSTATVMAGIREHGFDDHLGSLPVPLLGICVGMQVLFEGSDEDGTPCLGLIEGTVRRLVGAPTLPHVGWNDLRVTGRSDLYGGLDEPVVYFVHSYAPVPDDDTTIAATARHGSEFVAGVRQGMVEGVQFHPERSGATGLRILSRFVASCRQAASAA